MIVTLQTERVQTLADVRAVIDGNDRLDYQFTDREAAYEFIRRTLVRFDYPTLSKPDKGIIRRYWGHQKVCSYDYGKEASSLGSTLWGACPGSVSTPRRPPVSSYFIVFGAIAPFRVTAPHRVCTRAGVAGARNC